MALNSFAARHFGARTFDPIANRQATARPVGLAPATLAPAPVFLLVPVNLTSGPAKVQCVATVEYPRQEAPARKATAEIPAFSATVGVEAGSAEVVCMASVSYAEHNERMRRILLALLD